MFTRRRVGAGSITPAGVAAVVVSIAVVWSMLSPRAEAAPGQTPEQAAAVTSDGASAQTTAPAATPLGELRTYNRGISPGAGIAKGPDGNVWFTNSTQNTIGKITPAGLITVYPTTDVDRPWGITSGPDGNVWFTSYLNNRIGKITPAGVVTTYTSAEVNKPTAITKGPDGNLWFTQGNDRIGRITPAGSLSFYSDPSINRPLSITAGSDGNVWFGNTTLTYYGNAGSIGRITPSGVVSSFTTTYLIPQGVALGQDGNVWFTSRWSGQDFVGRITPTGVFSTFTSPSIDEPTNITAGPDGALWFTNYDRLGRITTTGSVTTHGDPLGGNGPITTGSDGNLWGTSFASIMRATTAGVGTSFTGSGVVAPRGITRGPDNNLWFTNSTNLGRMTPAGVITYIPLPGTPQPHSIVVGPDGNLWFTDYGNKSIGKVTPAGVVTEYFHSSIFPEEIVAGPDGNLWFTVSYRPYAAIGKITPAGQITLFNFHNTLLGPWGLTWGPDGNLWIADSEGSEIGRMTPAGALTKFTAATVAKPRDIAVGPDGNLWFTNTDASNSSIGRITTGGSVTNFPHSGVASPFNILTGQDNALWFGNGRDDIGRITTDGDYSFYAVPSTTSSVYGLTNGPDGDVWFADAGAALLGAVGTRIVPQRFFGITPKRVLDSRDGTGTSRSPWFWAQTRNVTVAGGTTTVPASATAVVINVTGVFPSNPTHLTVWPSGLPMPVASNLNLPSGGPRSNLVTVKVGYLGQIAIFNNAGLVDVVGDVVGYYAADGTGALYTGVTPKRLLDSRDGTGGYNSPWTAGLTRELGVTGASTTVPADATAVVLNVTATGGTAGSHLSAWPSGGAMPLASNLNFAAGATVPNLVVVKVGTGGRVSIFNNSGSVQVIADVVGYYRAASGGAFTGLTPKRLLDSRNGTGGHSTPWSAGLTRPLTVAGGSTSVPANATAVILNVTGVGPTSATHLTVWPAGSPMPLASNLNLPAGDVRPNLVMVKVGSNHQVSIFNNSGNVEVLADVVGYFV